MPQNGIITPAKMMAVESLVMIVWVAVGGRGTLTGAIIGCLLVNLASSYFTSHLPKAWPFVLGGMFVLVVLLLPDGLVGAWRRYVLKRKPEAS